jgi:hypothetical protein
MNESNMHINRWKSNKYYIINKGYGYSVATSSAVAFAGGGGAGAVATATLVHKGFSRTIDNFTTFENSRKNSFNLNNLFSNVQLVLNSVVVVDSIAVPGLVAPVNDPLNRLEFVVFLVTFMIQKEKIIIILLLIYLKLLIILLISHF